MRGFLFPQRTVAQITLRSKELTFAAQIPFKVILATLYKGPQMSGLAPAASLRHVGARCGSRRGPRPAHCGAVFPQGPRERAGVGRGSAGPPPPYKSDATAKQHTIRHLKDRVGHAVPPPTHARSIKTQGVRDTLTSPGDVAHVRRRRAPKPASDAGTGQK